MSGVNATLKAFNETKKMATARSLVSLLLNTSGEVQNLKNTLTKLFLNVMVNFINNYKNVRKCFRDYN
jgi:hypothetical protein